MEEKNYEIGDYVYVRFEIKDIRTIKDTKRKYLVLSNDAVMDTLYVPISNIGTTHFIN